MAYDDFQNSSTLTRDGNGTNIKRTIYLRADTEVDALADTLCPKRGDAINISGGSAVQNIYCQSVVVDSLPASGDQSGNFLWKVTADYAPLSGSNPTPNKAKWSVGFRAQQFVKLSVKKEGDQAHYGLEGSAANEWPPVTTGINVTEDGPQGVDVDEMVEVLTLDFWMHPEDVQAYLATARGIVNTVNVSAFEGPWGTYGIGEARITGLSVSTTTGEVSTVSIEISRSVSGSITTYLDSISAEVTYAKNGWEYAWVRFIKNNKQDETQIRPLSIDAHVATVYPSGDFSVLGVSEGIFV